MPHGDNPAARLAWFMNQLRPHAATPGAAAVVCCGVFGVSWPGDMSLLLSRLGEVALLARKTRSITDGLPPEASAPLLMRHFGEVEQVVDQFGSVASIPLQALLGSMKETGWHSLEIASDLLHRYARESTLDGDAVSTLIESVRELADQIRNADDLDADLRRWVLDRLAEIEYRLTDVDLYGLDGIEQAADQLLGGLLRSPSKWEQIRSSSIGRNLGKFVVALDLALNLATNAQALTASSDSQPGQAPVIVQIQQQFVGPVALPPAEGN